jgi:hypothetical protein
LPGVWWDADSAGAGGAAFYCGCKITIDSAIGVDRMKSIRQYFRVDRRKIFFLKFIFEAYDGIASITTLNPELGIVALSIPPGCEADVAEVINALQEDIMIEPFEVREEQEIENCTGSGQEGR